jgi:serine/threonine protein kinase/tetratricopeptide (TPR) repeat protein
VIGDVVNDRSAIREPHSRMRHSAMRHSTMLTCLLVRPKMPAQRVSLAMIGQTLGHYRIVSKIGAGGMGVVYRAHDEQLDRDVALKVLPAGTLADEAARKQFRKEALALAKLNHPNIETVYEFATTDSIDFLAMELIPGQPLSARTKEGSISQGEIVRLAIQLAEGLSAAHERGVIHRDLKPGNLFVTPDGRLKILDFGLAKLVHPEPEVDITQSITTATRTISGTVPYMSPEQLRGLSVDTRSDIYAAGAVLYEMAAGRRPFPQSQNAELVGAILHKSPDLPSSLNPDISPGLEHVISKALEKDPAQRYQSARELRVALESISSSSRPSAPPHDVPNGVPTVRPRTLIFAGGAVLASVLIAGLMLGTNIRGVLDRLSRHRASGRDGSGLVVSTPVRARRSVAVLGFTNISGQSDKAWISTALSEMLTTELAAGEELRTVPGENVAQMKINLSLADAESYGQETLEKIHRNLNADDVILGSYVPLGDDGIRLDMRLQDAVRGETIAAVSEIGSERQMDDLVSRAGVELRGKLGIGDVRQTELAAVKATLPSNPDAARLYSKGLEKLRLFEALASVELFERAIAAEPNFGLAHSALANAWSVLGYDANAALDAKKAFSLSSKMPREQRLWVEGQYRESTYDWAKAIEVYKALRNLFPDNLEYGLRLVTAQTASGHGRAALATIEELRVFPPATLDDARISLAEASAATSLGDFKRAQTSAERAITQGQSAGARLVVARARLAQSSSLRDLGKTKEATQAAEEARQLFAAAGDRGGVASALINQGNLFYRGGEMTKAKRAWEESLSISRSIGYEANIQTCLNNFGSALWHTGDLAGAKRLLDESLRIANRTGNKRKAAQATTNLAGVLYEKGDLRGAERAEQSALEMFRQIGDRSGVATALSNLGMIQSDQEDFTGARKRYEEALSVFLELGERSGAASATNKLATLLYQQSKFLEAKPMYDQALAAYGEIGDKKGVLMTRGNLGNVFYDLGNLPEARKMYDQSLALARESENNSAVGLALQNIGDVLQAQGDFDGARKAYDESLTTRKAIGDEGGVLGSRLALAALSIEEGDPAAAESTAREAAEKFRKDKASLGEAGALATLAHSFLKQGKTPEAETAVEKASRLAAKSQQSELRTPIFIMAARIHSTSGKTTTAAKSLQSILNEEATLGNVPLQFEARLAMGEMEMRLGETTAGRSRLASLEKDAIAKGFLLIAHKAHAAAGQ